MLAQAQKAVATTGIERLMAFVGSLAGAHPDVLDTIDFDEVVNEYADLLGVAPKLLASPAAVAAARTARARAVVQQQMMKNGLALAQGAQVLSKIDVGGGQNALEKALGGDQ